MPLPPGYELEKQATGLPAGYTLEQPVGEKHDATLPGRPVGAGDVAGARQYLEQRYGPNTEPLGFWGTLKQGVSGLVKSLTAPPGPGEIQTPPTGGPGVGQLAGMAPTQRVLGGMWSGAKHEAGRTVEEARAGHPIEAAGHGLATVLPGVGPAAAHAGEEFAQGNPAGGAAESLMLLAPFALPSVLRATASKVAKPFGTELSEGATAAREAGIPTLPSESAATGTWGRRMLERFLMNRALGREPFYNFKAVQNQMAQQAAEAIGGKMGLPAPPAVTGAGVGETLAGQDTTALTGLAKAEANRVGALNADALAQSRATNVRTADLARQTTGANAQLESESAKAAAQANEEALAHSRSATTLSGDLSRQAQGANAQLDTARTAARARSLNDLSDLSEQVGPTLPHEQVGQGAQASFKDSAQAFKAQAHELYSAIDQATGGTIIDLSPIKTWMMRLRQDLSGIGGATAALKGQDVAKLIETADRWGKAPMSATFADASDVLSALKSVGREYSGLINSRYPGVIKSLTTKLESQMQEAAGKAGVLDQYKQANTFYRQGAQLFNESKVADLMDKNPEQLSSAIWRPNSITDVRDVHTALSSHPDVWQTVQRRGVEDLFERSMKAGELDAGKLQSEWTKLGKPVQEELVGKENWKAFDGKIRGFSEVSKPVEPLEVPGAKVVAPTLEKPKPISPFEAPSSAPSTPKLEKPQPVSLDLTPQQKSLRVLASTHPEKLAENLTSRGAETLWPELQKSLSDNPALLNQVRRQSFESLVSRSLGQNMPDGSAVLNNKSLVKNWRELGPHVQSHIAGDQLADVNKLMSALNVIDLTKLPTLHNAIYGGVLDPAAVSAGLGDMIFRGDWRGGAAAAGWMLAPKYMARAMTSPAGIKWMTQGLTVPADAQSVLNWMTKGAAYTGLAVGSSQQHGLPAPPAKGLPAPPTH